MNYRITPFNLPSSKITTEVHLHGMAGKDECRDGVYLKPFDG
jgi:hypothetical protein